MTNDTIENRPFEELRIGDSASVTKTVTLDDVALFAAISGDGNPIHLDAAYSGRPAPGVLSAHSMYGGALISAVLGAKLPGPGTVYCRPDTSLQPRDHYR